MANLPEEITAEEQVIIDQLSTTIAKIDEADGVAAAERDTRDGLIAELRLRSWSLRQVALLTGYSAAQIQNISEAQGLVSTRGAVRK